MREYIFYTHKSLPPPIPPSLLTLRLSLLKLQSVGRFAQSTLQPLLLLQLHELVLGLGGAFSAKGREGGREQRRVGTSEIKKEKERGDG